MKASHGRIGSRIILVFLVLYLTTGALTVEAIGQSPVRRVPQGGCPDLIDLIKELKPTVVNISIERHILQHSSTRVVPLFRTRPDRLDHGDEGRERFQNDSLGSGFFCDSDGHVVTNAHVVEGAAKILVTLSSGKVIPARVVAVHPDVDLALLKIKPPYPLKRVDLGDSSKVQVGEWVLAMGNPFGLGRSVTVGIVSGKGRFLGLGSHDNFIQTDASINPGNSGGPLFNMAGEVVGVNTAIIAAGRGIGFSIPSNYIKELTAIAHRTAPPSRGWLGIYVDDLSAEQAQTLGAGPVRGTVVDEVLQSTPAFLSGIRKGDLILNANGEQIRSGRHLSRIVAGTRPGDLLRLMVLRGGKTHSIDVKIGKSPE
ncbi:MAG: trypsin-like peptidase domain-containing protein [Desulfomonilaceae bacterium]|nr:trypsin-like peptidase domain-containing protein [Desulfomonilaceae bacterium]